MKTLAQQRPANRQLNSSGRSTDLTYLTSVISLAKLVLSHSMDSIIYGLLTKDGGNDYDDTTND
jgi:hypothetical protein